MSDVAVTIDWLSYTMFWNNPLFRKYNPAVSYQLICERATGITDTWVFEPPLHGYRYGYVSVSKPGLRVMMSPSGHQMGIHVQWSGSALAGESVLERLEYALNKGGQVTRVDLAVDVSAPWRIRKYYDDALAGGCKTKARKFSIIESTEGTTMYVGSRTSGKYLRIYDKAAQTNSTRPWTRVELECKGSFAQNISKYIQREGLRMIPAVIRGFADFEHVPAWATVMHSEIDRVSVPQVERFKNTRGWLLESVAPALAKYELENPGFLSEFGGRVNMLLDI